MCNKYSLFNRNSILERFLSTSDETILYLGLLFLFTGFNLLEMLKLSIYILGCISLYKILSFFYDFTENYIKKKLGKINKQRINHSQWIMVTGSTDGIGKAIAKISILQNKNIVIIGRDQNKINKVLEEFENIKYNKNESVLVDLSKIESIQTYIDFWVNEFDRLPVIDMLFNNAGISLKGPIISSNYTELISILNVNVISPLVITNTFLYKSKMENNIENKFVELTSSGLSMLAVPYSKLYPFTKWFSTTMIKYYSHKMQSFGFKNIFTYVLLGEVITKLSSGVANFETLTENDINGMSNLRYITSNQAAYSILFQGIGNLETSGHPNHYIITLFVKFMKATWEAGIVKILTKKRIKYLKSQGCTV